MTEIMIYEDLPKPSESILDGDYSAETTEDYE